MTTRRSALSALAVIAALAPVAASGSALLAGKRRVTLTGERTAANHEKAVETTLARVSSPALFGVAALLELDTLSVNLACFVS
jgi:hypothetical protein